MRKPSGVWLIGTCVLATVAGCEASDTSAAQRQVLADGRVIIAYPSIPSQEDTVVANLRIGELEGGTGAFGLINGIEAGKDGRIYVLDSQASELRVFRSDGSYESTLARGGPGPGEMGDANGLSLGLDETLWIEDRGNHKYIGISLGNRGVIEHPRRGEFSYPAFWRGRVTDDGRLWQQVRRYEPPGGITIGRMTLSAAAYYQSFDPRTEEYDSVSVGLETIHVYQDEYQGSPLQIPVPFTGTSLLVMDQIGRIWTAETDSYTVMQLNSNGDTTLTIQVNQTPPPVTASDREAWRTSMAPFFERFPTTMAAVEPLTPETKPVLTQLVTDDEGRVWIGRTVEVGQLPAFDVFDAEGAYLRTVRLFDRMYPLAPVIRDGRIYAVVLGDLDEHYVVRAELPHLGPD